MNDKAFSSIDLVGQCLLDNKRTNFFKEAIEKEVKTGDIVLDIGTGSGILAIFAAKAGAKKVYAVEKDPFVASVAEKNIRANNLENKIEIILSDSRNLDFVKNDHIDLVIMEMLTTGMIDELQIPTLNHIKKYKNIDTKTKFLPKKQLSYVTFGYSDLEMYGVKIPMILHLWDIHADYRNIFKEKTEKIVFDNYDFSKDDRLYIQRKIKTSIKEKTIINSLLLESESFLTDNLILKETPALNGKVLIPIEERSFENNEELIGDIKYGYGEGFESFNFNW